MASIGRIRMMSSLLVIAAVIAALLASVIGLIWVFQERIAFQPPRGPWPDVPDTRRVEFTAKDGQPLFAYVVGDANPSGGLLISFHGNADLAVWQIGWAEEIARRTGITIMLTEYRGYMGLRGRPSYETSQLDAEAAYDFARDGLQFPAERLAFFGHSLGTAIAAELAVEHPPAALLLQSPFTSAREMTKRMVGYEPSGPLWRLISRLHYDTGARVAQILAPVSVVHGEADGLIPAAMGRKIFDAAKVKGSFLLVSGASHNDVAQRGGESYWNWISHALEGISRR